jgi:hypothetical protein
MKPIEQARLDLNAAQARGEHDDFMKRAGAILRNAMKFKKALQKRNLMRGKAKCPFCAEGHWHGVLAGPKQHLHMSCDGCDVMMME